MTRLVTAGRLHTFAPSDAADLVALCGQVYRGGVQTRAPLCVSCIAVQAASMRDWTGRAVGLTFDASSRAGGGA